MATFEPITKRDDPAEIAALATRYLAEKRTWVPLNPHDRDRFVAGAE
jgi:hypothetical protein